MPLPLVFIGIAALTGATGIGTGVKAGVDNAHAHSLISTSNEKIDKSGQQLNDYRIQCGEALKNIGEEKLFVLNNGIKVFLENFQKIKNVDFKESEGILEINKLHIDQKEFEELKALSHFAIDFLSSGATGATAGALSAVGAYSAATMFATASTGTAISTLSGAAATNATLAFFGGGSLATGGLGMAGGTAVLGGLVAGPALMVMGLMLGAKAETTLENAYSNAAKADEICEELLVASEQCIAIRRRCYMYYSLLARLDALLYSQNLKMIDIIDKEGIDYSQYSPDSKKAIAAVVSTVASIKAVLDTPILSADGNLTDESGKLIEGIR